MLNHGHPAGKHTFPSLDEKAKALVNRTSRWGLGFRVYVRMLWGHEISPADFKVKEFEPTELKPQPKAKWNKWVAPQCLEAHILNPEITKFSHLKTQTRNFTYPKTINTNRPQLAHNLEPGEALRRPKAANTNIGALIITVTVGFRGPFSYNYNKEPPK